MRTACPPAPARVQLPSAVVVASRKWPPRAMCVHTQCIHGETPMPLTGACRVSAWPQKHYGLLNRPVSPASHHTRHHPRRSLICCLRHTPRRCCRRHCARCRHRHRRLRTPASTTRRIRCSNGLCQLNDDGCVSCSTGEVQLYPSCNGWSMGMSMGWQDWLTWTGHHVHPHAMYIHMWPEQCCW